MDSDKLTGKLARWALMLQEYEFQVVHRAGSVNLDADGLSCNPCPSQQDTTGTRWHGETDEEMARSCIPVSLSHEAHAEPVDDIIENTRPIDFETSGELGESKDVYDDSGVLSYLQTGELTVGLPTKDRIGSSNKPRGSNGRGVICSAYGRMERYGLCLFQLSKSDWLGMPMKIWDILEYDVLTTYSKDSTGGGVCMRMFNSLWPDVWCVIGFGHPSMHLHHNYILCQSWG